MRQDVGQIQQTQLHPSEATPSPDEDIDIDREDEDENATIQSLQKGLEGSPREAAQTIMKMYISAIDLSVGGFRQVMGYHNKFSVLDQENGEEPGTWF